MKLISALAASVGHTAYAYAGTHLGGLLHAGPIPWDDDADVAMLYGARDAFVAAVRAYNAPDEAFRIRGIVSRFGSKTGASAPSVFLLGVRLGSGGGRLSTCSSLKQRVGACTK